jgi:hypothetical protein
MSNTLMEKLSLSQQEKSRLGKRLSKIKSVSKFLSDAIDAFKDTSLPSAIAKAAPWAGMIGKAAGEIVPPVKFAIAVVEKLTTEHDPEALGYFACTLAYQRGIQQTVDTLEVPIVSKKEERELAAKVNGLKSGIDDVSMKDFSFGNALSHPFIKKADEALRTYSDVMGYSATQSRQLVSGVHTRFVGNLKTLLSHGKLKERFEPFTQLMELGTGEQQAYEALYEHAEYQRWQFEEDPVFKKEPFALAHIYVETECGKLLWGEINSPVGQKSRKNMEREQVDPFSEKWGGRHDLVETVLELIGDSSFREAIVIQGIAGSGKSSFTLRLCSELIKEGLRPIRVRLRDLQLDKHVSERLPEAVLLEEKDRRTGQLRPDDLFLGGDIFKEETVFRGARICPYILILDGWDEISISATEGFKVRVSKMLDEIRSQFLSTRGTPIRILLTGRPSAAVSESNFLRDRTPVLTIRTLSPSQLQKFVRDLAQAVKKKPIELESTEADQWAVPESKHFSSVFEQYEMDFEASLQTQRPPEDRFATRRAMYANPRGSLAVLGLPLLAFLAVRLISQWKGDITGLLEDSTTLYRALVDMTCEKAGRPSDDISDFEGKRARVTGIDLRQLLRRTAAAMTIFGEEAISYTELALRLNYQGEELDYRATEATKDSVLTSLMISFYFKGGHPQLGCEFLHKSFREYLFAEAISETLKEFGWKQKQSLAEREPYWSDFGPSEIDFRHEFSRRLSELLAPQWLSPEVSTHLERLITWEINRTTETESGIGTPPNPLDTAGWERVRDGLADMWDWWAEGVHLRPQPIKEKLRRTIEFQRSYAEELVELSAPLDTSQTVALPEPSRVLTMDAHLGEGLIRICALVHYQLAVRSGWLKPRAAQFKTRIAARIWEGVSAIGSGPRRCQSLVRQQGRTWTLFAPSGIDPDYFAGHCHRINAGGWRPHGDFPFGANLSGIDLRGATIQPGIPLEPPLGTVWTHANISGANCAGGCFYDHRMSDVLAEEVRFWYSLLETTKLTDSVLTGSRFVNTYVYDSNIEGAELGHIRGLEIRKHKSLRLIDASEDQPDSEAQTAPK